MKWAPWVATPEWRSFISIVRKYQWKRVVDESPLQKDDDTVITNVKKFSAKKVAGKEKEYHVWASIEKTLRRKCCVPRDLTSYMRRGMDENCRSNKTATIKSGFEDIYLSSDAPRIYQRDAVYGNKDLPRKRNVIFTTLTICFFVLVFSILFFFSSLPEIYSKSTTQQAAVFGENDAIATPLNWTWRQEEDIRRRLLIEEL